MKGLTVFVADIRKCRGNVDAEEQRVQRELAHIRNQFQSTSLSSYQLKKYVATLIYCHLLGYNVDIGGAEALMLMHSTVYSEKSIGYLAATLLLAPDMARLAINSIRLDLESQNEIFVCLALNAIANFSLDEIMNAVVEDVVKLLFSAGVGRSFVCKKAALCLLKILRRNSHLEIPSAWIESIVRMIQECNNFGVLEALSPLILELSVQRQISNFEGPCLNRIYSVGHLFKRFDAY